jgi:hypothetical protein
MKFLRRLPAPIVLVVVALLSLVIGFLWILLAPRLLSLSSLTASQWSELGVLTSVAGFALVIGAGFLVLVELTEATNSRNLDVYRDIYERLMSEPAIEARRYLYQEIPAAKDGGVLVDAVLKNQEARDCVKKVLNLIDYFGFLVAQDWVTEDEVVGWLSPVVVKVWARIEPIVEHECALRPEEPDYYLHARTLADKCEAWRRRKFPSSPRKIVFDRQRL